MHADRQVVHHAQATCPALVAAAWVADSCSSSTHCNQRWKSTASSLAARNSATAGAAGCRRSAGQSCQSGPCTSNSAHQVA